MSSRLVSCVFVQEILTEMKNFYIFLDLFFFTLVVQIKGELMLLSLFGSLVDDILQISPLSLAV